MIPSARAAAGPVDPPDEDRHRHPLPQQTGIHWTVGEDHGRPTDEIMPELAEITPWHIVGKRRRRNEYGRIVEFTLSDEVFAGQAE